ncbi:hypothetical protein PCE1_002173 [Barthelona sp. PCE]
MQIEQISFLQSKREQETGLEHNFGILPLKVPSGDVMNSKYNIVIQSDRSGSMALDASQEGGQTCMQLTKKTIKSIIKFLGDISTKSNVEIILTILFFDHAVEACFETIAVTKENAQELCDQVEQWDSRGQTNMFDAINRCEEYYREEYQNISINLTDGQPNCSHTKSHQMQRNLNPIVRDNFEHNLIGFGMSHNEKLLYTLSKLLKGDYYFVDNVENCGMIYGEILNKVLYKRYTDIELSSEIIEFYDHLTGDWVKNLKIKSMFCDEEDTIHLRMGWDVAIAEPLVVKIKYTDLEENEVIEQDMLIGADVYDSSAESPIGDRDLEVHKYLFRQRAVELMFQFNEKYSIEHEDNKLPNLITPGPAPLKIRRKTKRPTRPPVQAFQPEPQPQPQPTELDELKGKVETLFEEIKVFITDKGLDDDLFMTQILDDLSVTFQQIELSSETNNRATNVFGLGRYISQCRHRAYNIAQCDFESLNPTPQVRAFGASRAAMGAPMLAMAGVAPSGPPGAGRMRKKKSIVSHKQSSNVFNAYANELQQDIMTSLK